MGGECRGVGYCRQMLRACSCCYVSYNYPPTTQSDPDPKSKDAEAVKSGLSCSLSLKMTLMMSLFAYPSINGHTMVLRTISFSSTFYMLLNMLFSLFVECALNGYKGFFFFFFLTNIRDVRLVFFFPSKIKWSEDAEKPVSI